MTVQTKPVARPARREDAQAIARSYNQGIEDRIAPFETEPRTRADIERLLEDRLGRYPAVVVQRESLVVAWASTGRYRARPYYDPDRRALGLYRSRSPRRWSRARNDIYRSSSIVDHGQRAKVIRDSGETNEQQRSRGGVNPGCHRPTRRPNS